MNLTEDEAMEVARSCQTVAVIGMTDGSKPGRESYNIPQMLQQRGIRVIPVNPRIEESLGEKALDSVAELSQVPDVFDVFRRSEAIPEIAEELLALPAEYRKAVVWLQSTITHPEAEKKLEDAGFKLVSDRCLGTFVAMSGRPLLNP